MNNNFVLQEKEVVNLLVFSPTESPTISPTYTYEIMEDQSHDANNSIPIQLIIVIVFTVMFFCLILGQMLIIVYRPRENVTGNNSDDDFL